MNTWRALLLPSSLSLTFQSSSDYFLFSTLSRLLLLHPSPVPHSGSLLPFSSSLILLHTSFSASPQPLSPKDGLQLPEQTRLSTSCLAVLNFYWSLGHPVILVPEQRPRFSSLFSKSQSQISPITLLLALMSPPCPTAPARCLWLFLSFSLSLSVSPQRLPFPLTCYAPGIPFVLLPALQPTCNLPNVMSHFPQLQPFVSFSPILVFILLFFLDFSHVFFFRFSLCPLVFSSPPCSKFLFHSRSRPSSCLSSSCFFLCECCVSSHLMNTPSLVFIFSPRNLMTLPHVYSTISFPLIRCFGLSITTLLFRCTCIT